MLYIPTYVFELELLVMITAVVLAGAFILLPIGNRAQYYIKEFGGKKV
jgi:hypothetical protein